MSVSDRERWNERYLTRAELEPSSVLTEILAQIPVAPNPALDLAGGDGRHAAWLQQHGWQAMVLDISRVALERARRREPRLFLVEAEATFADRQSWLPLVPCSLGLVVIYHYLDRPLLEAIDAYLVPGGSFVMVHPTRRNLERHARPPERFLLDEGELPTLVKGLEARRYREDWSSEGRHEAVFWGERPY